MAILNQLRQLAAPRGHLTPLWAAASYGVFGLAASTLALNLADRPAAMAVATTVGAIGLIAVIRAAVLARDPARDAQPPAAVESEHGSPYIEDDDAKLIELLRNAFSNVSDGFVLWDSDDRLVAHNRRIAPKGWPPPPLGTRFLDHVRAMYTYVDDGSTGGSVETWIALRQAAHEAADGTQEILLKDGRWILVTERRCNDGSTVAIYTDITTSKDDVMRRASSERRLAHAQKLANVGIWEWDTRKGEMFWSDILYQIFGIPEDTTPLSLDQYLLIVHPGNRDLVRSTHKRLLSTGGQYNQEYQIIRPDGQARTVRTEAEAITDVSGRIIRVLGAVHDITDLKSAERGLRRAKEFADEANRAKSEFLANVSHELRTPLNAVIGFSEVMLQEVFGPMGNDRYREYAADIRQSGAHLLGVINDLLDFSKLEAGHLELHVEAVSLPATIDKTIRLMREHAQSAEVTLIGDVAQAGDAIEADERKITQILLNLVSNAIKFTPEGGLVTVRAAGTSDGVEITVTDTGVGMTKDDIELALSPFGQVDSSANRRHTGTGLGLPLSRSLAELHGGVLEVKSAPGAGTTVIVQLPKTLDSGTDGSAEPTLRLVMGGQPR